MKSSEYNYKVSFCDSIYYSSEDIVKIISKAVFDHQLCNMPEYRNIAMELAIVKESEGENDSIHKTQNADFNKEAWLTYQNTIKVIYEEEELRDQQYYFMDRMIKSVLNHEIEFWNVDATQVIDISSTDLGLKPKGKSPEPVSVEYALKKLRSTQLPFWMAHLCKHSKTNLKIKASTHHCIGQPDISANMMTSITG